MFWPEARILRLAKASQGCLAFAVVHSPMATESVGENGRGAASKNRSGHFERLSKRLEKAPGARTDREPPGIVPRGSTKQAPARWVPGRNSIAPRGRGCRRGSGPMVFCRNHWRPQRPWLRLRREAQLETSRLGLRRLYGRHGPWAKAEPGCVKATGGLWRFTGSDPFGRARRCRRARPRPRRLMRRMRTLRGGRR